MHTIENKYGITVQSHPLIYTCIDCPQLTISLLFALVWGASQAGTPLILHLVAALDTASAWKHPTTDQCIVLIDINFSIVIILCLGLMNLPIIQTPPPINGTQHGPCTKIINCHNKHPNTKLSSMNTSNNNIIGSLWCVYERLTSLSHCSCWDS